MQCVINHLQQHSRLEAPSSDNRAPAFKNKTTQINNNKCKNIGGGKLLFQEKNFCIKEVHN